MFARTVLLSLVCTATGALAQDAVQTDGDKHKAIFENDCVRVLDYQDRPGQATHQHRHPAFVLYALAPVYYPPQSRAAGAGASVAAGRLGSIVGPLIAGQLRAVGYGPGDVLNALAPAAVVTMAAVFVLTTYAKPYREA